MSTTQTTPAPESARRRTLLLALWAIQLLLAFQFAGAGVFKLSGAPEMVELFAAIGAGQWLRYVVGGLEVAGAVGLLIPRLAGLAALGLSALMVGAAITNLVILETAPWLPLALLLLCLLVVWGRRSWLPALADARRR